SGASCASTGTTRWARSRSTTSRADGDSGRVFTTPFTEASEPDGPGAGPLGSPGWMADPASPPRSFDPRPQPPTKSREVKSKASGHRRPPRGRSTRAAGLLATVAACCAGACSRPDVCADHAGATCIAIHIESSGLATQIDQLVVTAANGFTGLDHMKTPSVAR